MMTPRRLLSPTTALLAACAALPMQGSLQAQGGVPLAPQLPANRTAEVGQAFADLRLEDALRAALNSPDDSIKMTLQGGGSAALIAFVNVGGQISLDLEVKKAESGFEVAIGRSDAAAAGIEVYEGLEVNLKRGTEQKVVFRFADVPTASTAIQCLALGKALHLREVLPALLAQLQGVQARLQKELATLQGILDALDAARTLEQTRRAARSAAYAALAAAQTAYNQAVQAYNAAVSAYNSAYRTLQESPVPGFLKGPLKEALSAAWQTLSNASTALNTAYSAFLNAQNAYNAADQRWRTAVASVTALQQSASHQQTIVNSATQSVGRNKQYYGRYSNLRDAALRYLAGVEFKLFQGQSLSAVLTVPGVNLADLGLGAQVAGTQGARIKVAFPSGSSQPRTITVSGLADLSSRVFAGIGVGLEGRSKAELSVNATFVENMKLTWQNYTVLLQRTGSFRFAGVAAQLDVDLQARALAGVGWNAVAGVGRRIRIKMDSGQWISFFKAARSLVEAPTLDGFVQALRGLQLEVRCDDRWIAGGAATFGGSVAGWGASFGGESLWNDRGTEQAYTLDAGALLDSATDPAEVQAVLTGLVARMP